jgi:hypothetical protein
MLIQNEIDEITFQAEQADDQVLLKVIKAYVRLKRDFDATNSNLSSVQTRSNDQLMQYRSIKRATQILVKTLTDCGALKTDSIANALKDLTESLIYRSSS